MQKILGGTLAIAAVGLAGCSSQPVPTGTSSGRVPPGWSTPAESGDARILPDDYEAFIDEWSQVLIRNMNEYPAFQNLPYRATVLFGDIVNKTDIISSVEFESVREGIKNRLLGSQTFNQRFRFLISRAQLDSLRRQEVNKPVAQERFDEMHTYLLNGTMFRVSRGDTHAYRMTYQLVNFETGEIVFAKEYYGKRFGR